MRHRKDILETGVLFVIVVLVGFGALVFDLEGRLSSDQRIELFELIGLGVVIACGLGYLSWRHIREQDREIEARIHAEDHARYLAHHDQLTGLPNRLQLERALKSAITILPSAERVHAIFVLDLNGFKKINDRFGHATGDKVLSVVGKRLASTLREGDLVARIGGDEFAMVVRDVAGVEGAQVLAQRVISELDEPIADGNERHRIGTGVGIALIPKDGTETGELLRRADVALYKAKRDPLPGYAFFQDEMDRESRERDMLQRDLAAAIGTGSIVPHFQPILDLDTDEIKAFEALARWTHPTLGDVPPERFIPIAENSRLIGALTDHLLTQACAAATQWPDSVGLSFNVSPTLLRDPDFSERLLSIVQRSGLPLRRLELEITENAIVHDLHAAQQVLGALNKKGVRIALDDFGTGATSLFHLRSFKFDAIKIDRSFIDLMTGQKESAAIVKALLGLGRGLGVDIIAEGIEKGSQSAMLRGEGCRLGQGFLYSEAVSDVEAASLVNRGKAASAA